MISHDKLNEIVSGGGQFAQPISAAADRFEINTPDRLAAFIAQIAHESARFTRLEENLNYSAQGLLKTWPTRFTPSIAESYARHPERIANYVYANRLGNGDEASGDGWRYRGRGLIQLTGRANYRECGLALGMPFEAEPEIVAQPHYAAMTAGWFWKSRGLNEHADRRDFLRITRIINGGIHGLADREKIWRKALEVLAA